MRFSTRALCTFAAGAALLATSATGALAATTVSGTWDIGPDGTIRAAADFGQIYDGNWRLDYTFSKKATGMLTIGGELRYTYYSIEPWGETGGNEEPWWRYYEIGKARADGQFQFRFNPVKDRTAGNNLYRSWDSYDTHYIDLDFGSAGPVDYTFTVYRASAVPEPSVWALLVAGFGFAGAALRRRPRVSGIA